MKKESAAKTQLHIILKILMVLSTLIFLFSFFASLRTPDLSDESLKADSLTPFANGWTSKSSTGEQIPVSDISSMRLGSDGTCTIYHKLPQVYENDCLFFQNNYNRVEVFVNGTRIYDYNKNVARSRGRTIGNLICQVPLNSSYSGQTISIGLTQLYDKQSTGITSVAIGTHSSYIINYLYSHVELIASLFLMVIFSICLLVIYFWQKRLKISYDYKLFLDLAVFIFFSAVWIWSDSQLPQLLFRNGIVVYIVSFFSFMALPIPLLSFVAAIFPKSKSVLKFIEFLFLLNLIVQGSIYLLKILDFPKMLLATHILFVIGIIVLLYSLFYEIRKNKSFHAKIIVSALLLLIASGVISLLYFYISPATDNSRFLRYGLLVFILVLIFLSLKIMIQFLHKDTQAKVMKQLAYTDILTGVESRLSFEEAMDTLKRSKKQEPITFIVLDLNNLKDTNDTYGHKAGDEILKESACCIEKVFHPFGRTFRIGGDEFVVVLSLSDSRVPQLISQLSEQIQEFNQTAKYPFTLAHGYASSTAACGSDIEALFRRADANMYQNKVEMKAQVAQENAIEEK